MMLDIYIRLDINDIRSKDTRSLDQMILDIRYSDIRAQERKVCHCFCILILHSNLKVSISCPWGHPPQHKLPNLSNPSSYFFGALVE